MEEIKPDFNNVFFQQASRLARIASWDIDVDDAPNVRLVTKRMMHSIDSSVDCHQCDNGEIGLSVIEKLQNVTDYVVVLLDLNMSVFRCP